MRLAAAGYVYVQRRARKTNPCKMGDGDIQTGEQYFAVTIGGGGLGSLKFPAYIHLRCRDAHISMIEERERGIRARQDHS